MNSFDPSVLKIMTTYRCRYVFKKMSRGKLGKAAHELSGIVGTLNLLQRAFLFKYVRCRGPICFGERRKPSLAWGRKKKKQKKGDGAIALPVYHDLIDQIAYL